MGQNYAKMAAEERQSVKRQLACGRRPVNVLLVGLPSAGKSSLVSSLESCLSQEYGIEIGSAGKILSGEGFMFRLRKYRLFKESGVIGVNDSAPYVFEMPGMPNVDDDRIVAILRCIMRGRVPVNEQVLVQYGLKAADIEATYCSAPDEAKNRIDRVIFVHSCQDDIPQHLIDAVRSVCNSEGVTLFSVLTHHDARDHIVERIELDAAVGSVIPGCEVTLYHYRRGRQEYEADPRTDYYLLRLVRELLDTTYRINSTGPFITEEQSDIPPNRETDPDDLIFNWSGFF